jgi:glycosyltransferase involved in cell wall biosynthesis
VPADPHVVFLGRMTALKGGDLLVRAVARASVRLGHAVPLTMIGDGPQRAEWEGLARRLGVRAAFTGWLGGADRWPHVSSASVLAISSVWPEPFGLVGLEAAALGVPAIAIDTGGISEWLHDGVNGVLVPAPASASTFGDLLASLLSDPARQAALRAGALGRAREMSVDAHVSRLTTILHGVIRQGVSP